MHTEPLNILLLEDSEPDADLVRQELVDAGLDFVLERVETEAAFVAALVEFQPTIILADYLLPTFDGLSALDLVLKECPEIPFIVVSGHQGEELVIESLGRGATDYVLKTGLNRLGPAVNRALQEAAKQRELQQAQNALRNTTEQLNRLLASSPVVIYALKVDGLTLRATWISENITEILGYTATETLAKDWWRSHLHPDDAERVIADVHELLNYGRLVREYRIRHQDGSWRWIEDQQRIIKNDQGDPVEVAGVWTDITEIKDAKTNIMLRDSALQATADAVMITDAKGHIEWTNPAFSELTGYQSAEVAGKTPRVLKSGKHPPELYQQLWRTILSGEVWHGEMINRRKDGSLFEDQSSITPVRDQAGEVTHFIAIKRDISAQRQVEREMEKLAAFPRHNPNPVLEFTSSGDLAYANAAAEELALVVNRPIPQLLPPDIIELIQECLNRGNSTDRIPVEIDKRTLNWVFFPIVEQDVVHGYATDITDRLRLEEQFRQSQKMEAVGLLSSGVAHDFNNLLSVIIGNAELCQTQETSPIVTESLCEVVAAANRAASLTRQLLTFSRKQPLRQESLNLNDVVDNMGKMLKRIQGEDIELDFQPAESLPNVSADVGMMEQIVLNLAVNARDAMPEGGRLGIVTTMEDIDEEYVRLHHGTKPGRYVCLSTRDTGTGMSQEVQKRIFEPFFTTKEEGKGTGLGLATVFGIVKQHEGWIQIYSELGEGTLFRIYLPAEDQKVVKEEKDTQPENNTNGHGTETILFAEDEPSVRMVAEKFLEHAGYKVILAEDGPKALAAWSQHRDEIRMLITDMIMPGGLNGRELAAQIQQDDPSLKVIFSSGYSTDSAGNEFVIGKGSGFLQKPYTPSKLLGIVREYLDAS